MMSSKQVTHLGIVLLLSLFGAGMFEITETNITVISGQASSLGNGLSPVNESSATLEIEVKMHKPCVWERANNKSCTSEFRDPQGVCTNKINLRKTWGMSTTPFIRLLPAQYEDENDTMKVTEFQSGNPLKSARVISTLVTSHHSVLSDSGHNAQVMQWGQFIAHEISSLVSTNPFLKCCPDKIITPSKGRSLTPRQLESARRIIRHQDIRDICIPVEADHDPVYGGYVCMQQERSLGSTTPLCQPGARQQMNGATHVIDSSAVYGSSPRFMNTLRNFTGGRMNVQIIGEDVLLPPIRFCDSKSRAENNCSFSGGDGRVQITPNLAATHTVFVLKHNQVADELQRVNSHWDDERVFQETRRIINGIMANIHYYEWLPIILGNTIIGKYNLNNYQGYDEDVNPSVLNEMAGAALRFGHSLINGQVSTVDDDGTVGSYNLTSGFGNQTVLYKNGVKACLRGLMLDRPGKMDSKFSAAMRDRLFRENNDIVSLTINRGRDHGFQSFNNYRRHYGLKVAQNFDELLESHTQEVVDGFKEAYTSVEDIELYIAGVTEIPMQGAIVGELFANIIGDGFSRLMRGDRFHFESTQGGLNTDQIRAIKDYKYSQLLCEASGMDRVNYNAFYTVTSGKTHQVKCALLRPLNLDLWKEDEE